MGLWAHCIGRVEGGRRGKRKIIVAFAFDPVEAHSHTTKFRLPSTRLLGKVDAT